MPLRVRERERVVRRGGGKITHGLRTYSTQRWDSASERRGMAWEARKINIGMQRKTNIPAEVDRSKMDRRAATVVTLSSL